MVAAGAAEPLQRADNADLGAARSAGAAGSAGVAGAVGAGPGLAELQELLRLRLRRDAMDDEEEVTAGREPPAPSEGAPREASADEGGGGVALLLVGDGDAFVIRCGAACPRNGTGAHIYVKCGFAGYSRFSVVSHDEIQSSAISRSCGCVCNCVCARVSV